MILIRKFKPNFKPEQSIISAYKIKTKLKNLEIIKGNF